MPPLHLILKKVSNGAEIPIDGALSIGRSDDNKVRLLEGKPSRHHALINAGPASVTIKDLGSVNGTFVNERRLEPETPQAIKSGDRLRFGAEEFVVVGNAPAPAIDPNKTQFDDPRLRAGATRAAATPAVPIPGPKPARKLPGAFEPKGTATVFVEPHKKSSPGALSAANNRLDPQDVPGDPPYLWVTYDDRPREKIQLTIPNGKNAIWTVGSESVRDIRLTEAGVSSYHAWLTHENKTWLLTDNISANGTFVNDTRVTDGYLSDGDRVRFGPVECVFRIPPAVAVPSRLQVEVLTKAVFRKPVMYLVAAFVLTLVVIGVAVKLLK